MQLHRPRAPGMSGNKMTLPRLTDSDVRDETQLNAHHPYAMAATYRCHGVLNPYF
jgi:hypothetical protein